MPEPVQSSLVTTIDAWLNTISGVIWGPITLVLLLGIGVYLTVGLRFMPWRRIGYAFVLLARGRRPSPSGGDISAFQALMTALSATIGTGNIAGVATAIAIGGPGAVFWMWITALFGMATKYAEAVLAVRYREVDPLGHYVGGPMYYIKNGLGQNWSWLATLFATFAMVAAFGIGNTVQANSVADATHAVLGVPTWISGILMAVITGIVIIGGIRRIAEVAERLVPLMAAVYVLGSVAIVALNVSAVPGAIATIVGDAFTGSAAAGGFSGASVLLAIRMGVARGIFSNEAGLGSAPMAHAAARTDNPVQQGMIGMLGTFIDTIIVCSLTALVIIISGLWTGTDASGEPLSGAPLSAAAFVFGLNDIGGFVVSFGLIVFAFTTILAWSYYGERCAEYLFGVRVIIPYRLLWIAALPLGAMADLGLVWLVADILNGLMAIPNLIALALLAPVVFRLTQTALKPG